MKNISKKIIALMIIVLLTIVTTTISNAANITTSLTTNSKLVAGGTVTVNINVNQPVYGMSTTLYYDTDVFESAQVTSKVATSSDLSNNIIVIESGSAMPAGTIGTITLKVKSSISKTEGKISISNGKLTDENITTQTTNNASITIYTDKNASGSEEEANTNKNEPQTSQGTKNITTSKTKSSKLPKAGDESTIAIATIAVILAVVAIVGFIKYTKQKDIK